MLLEEQLPIESKYIILNVKITREDRKDKNDLMLGYYFTTGSSTLGKVINGVNHNYHTITFLEKDGWCGYNNVTGEEFKPIKVKFEILEWFPINVEIE